MKPTSWLLLHTLQFPVVGIGLILLYATPLYATGFTDNHNSGTLTGWTTVGARGWNDSGGVAQSDHDDLKRGSFLINDYACNSDGTFFVKLIGNGDQNSLDGGVVFRYIDSTNYYSLKIVEACGNCQSADNKLLLLKNAHTKTSSAYATLQSNLDFSSTNKIYTIKVRAVGSTFTFWVSGGSESSYTDNTSPHLTGKVGYVYSGEPDRYMRFDSSSWVDTSVAGGSYTWDKSTSSGIQTGSGTWGTNSWWTLNGTTLTSWPGSGNSATFAGTDTTTGYFYGIGINGTIAVDSITFLNGSYWLSGGTAINFGTKNGIYVASGKTNVIATPITGSGGIIKYGSGRIGFGATNTYTGGTTISAGCLQIGQNSTSGTIPGDVVNNDTLEFNRSDGYTYTGTISGSGVVHQYCGGTLLFTQTNTGGGLIIGDGAGTMQFGNGGTAGGFSGWIYNGSSVVFNRSDSYTFSSTIGGAGSVTKSGSGTLIFSGANDYTGTTTISAGTLRIGAGSTSGAISSSSNVSNSGTLIFNRSDAYAYSGVISGTGAVTNTGAGTMTLSGTNTYTGTTTISAGAIRIGAGSTSGAISNSSNVSNSGTLIFNRSDAYAYSGVISGTGAVTNTGAGTTTLSGTNTYTGTTTISAGAIRIGAGSTSGAISNSSNVSNSGTLIFNRSDAYAYSGVISGTGAVTNTGAGTTTLSGTNTYTGTTTISAGAIRIGAGSTSGAISNSSNVSNSGTLIFNRSDAYAYSGVISGTGAVTNTGAGTTTLSGTNTYTGTTTISAGAIRIGAGGTSGAISNSSNVSNSGTLIFNRSDAYAYSGVISGTGAVTNTGAGTTTLSGTNTYTGTTTISAGTIQVGASERISNSSAVSLANTSGAIFNLNGYTETVGSISGGGTTGGNITLGAGTLSCGGDNSSTSYGGIISGTSGTLTKTGTGTLTLTGANTYTGTTTISGGTLQIGNNGTSGSITGDISLSSGSSLLFYRSDDYTWSGAISGLGYVTKSGVGALTLSGASSYTGSMTVSGGTLFITSSLSVSDMTIASGTTLGGTGSITCSNITANGAISPGIEGIGTLSTSYSITFSGSGSLVATLNGTTAGSGYDQVAMSNGTLTLASATLSLTLTYAPTSGHTYTIISNAGSNAVSGTFNGIDEGDTIALTYNGSTYLFTISYSGGTGNNDIVLTCVGIPAGEDYATWNYSQSITLNTTSSGANVSGNVLNFPVLVRLTPSNFTQFSQTAEGGADIRFAKTDGTHLSYEIERWVDQSGDNDTGIIWVLVDTVYGNNFTQSFNMYWGNSAAVDSSNGAAVFNTTNGFVGVYHFNATSGNAADVTSNELTGSANGNVTYASAAAIGSAGSFDGDGDYFDAGNSTEFEMDSEDKFTVSAWVYRSGAAILGPYEGIAAKYEWYSGGMIDYREYALANHATNGFSFLVSSDGTSTNETALTAGVVPTNSTWYYVTAMMDAGSMYIFTNGVQRNSATKTAVFGSTNGTFKIGLIDDDGTTIRQYWNGRIDEVRIENTNRSANWIKLCYENQKSNQVLVVMENYVTWLHSCSFIINTSDITTTNCIDFPLLLRLTSSNFDFSQALEDGADIRFAKTDGTPLSYEIERWDNSNELAEIWVKIDTVYGDNSTQSMTMYWGKSSASDNSDGEAVYSTSNGYQGVWHLNEDPSGGSGCIVDRTANSNDGTPNGSMNATDLVSSAIGKGLDFYASSSQYILVGTSSSLNPGSSDFSLSGWFKTTMSGTGFMAGKGAHSGSFTRYAAYVTSGTVATEIDDNTTAKSCASSATKNDGTWNYVTVVRDGTYLRLYINGSEDSNSPTSIGSYGSLDNTIDFRIGALRNSTTTVDFFTGILDEIRYSSSARSADWIKLCYETQKPDASLLYVDTSDTDLFRALSLRRYGALDSVYAGTNNWSLRFAANAGGGITFLAEDSASSNQVSGNLFSVVYNGHSSDTGTGMLSLLDSSIVYGRVRQQKSVSGQLFTLDYTVLGSGRLYIRVSAVSATSLSGGLEFRVSNNASSAYRNIAFGSAAATCQGVLHVDSSSGKYDVLMVPYDLWSSADQITGGSSYAGIKSSSWSSPSDKEHVWHFMIDISHSNLSDSATAYKYVADYRSSDTLGFYAGTPLLEQAWERDIAGQWPFDDGAGATSVADKSGNGNDGTIAGSATSWTSGKWWDGGLSLSGSDSVVVAHDADFDRQVGQTIMGWINPDVVLSSSALLLKKYSSGNVGYTLTGGTSGKVVYTINNGGTGVTLQSVTAPSTGTWSHVAAKLNRFPDQGFMKLFIDGKPDTVRTVASVSSLGDNTDAVVIGKGFDGTIDDVRIYNGLLSDEEIRAIALRGYSPELGMYSVRADNNNTVHCRMHGNPQNRYLPVLQITNWWSSALPTYVYLDEVLLTVNSDYFASLDDNRNRLTIGFNKVLTGTTVTIFIDDNSQDGYLKTGATKKMYCGENTVGTTKYFWVKNTSDTYFGTAADNEFYLNWKMSESGGKDGELWQMKSSVTNPGVLIDTSSGTNVLPGSDGNNDTWGEYTYTMSSYTPRSVLHVGTAFTYAVEESSQVRVRLRVNERIVSNTSSMRMVTRWTLYPTGQFYRYDSIYTLSASPSGVYAGIYFNDSAKATIYSNTSKLQASIIYSQTYPDFVAAWLALKNASGYQSAPFTADYITTRNNNIRIGFDFEQHSSTPSKWSSMVETVYYLDMHHSAMSYTSSSVSSMDSIGNGVQNIGIGGGAALGMVMGSLVTNSSGDLNSDGFAEQEGAYVVSADNNSVKFVLPALGDTCRYFPAFRVTNYTAVQRPQYVMVYDYDGTASKTLLEGYQFNSYVNMVKHELIVQLDSIFCDSVGIYISSDKTLAVKLSRFEARGGNRSDTLLWRTESEQENLGFRIMRRIAPEFFDSLFMLTVAGDDSMTAKGNIDKKVVNLLKKRLVTSADTAWSPVTERLIPGAPNGNSVGPREYRYIDRGVYNDIRYEYRLIVLDYKQRQEEHGPVAVIPHHIAPARFMLGLNYPNPFRYTTRIWFTLPVESKVDFSIYTLQGRLVRHLIRPDRKFSAEEHHVFWDGCGDNGKRVVAGPYLYRIRCDGFEKTKVMFMLRG